MENRAGLLLNTLFAGGSVFKPPAKLENIILRQVPAGRAFLLRDTPADTVYFLIEGTARVVVSSSDGREAIIDVVDAPHLFGVTEVVGERPVFGATCAAATDCTIAKLPAEEFLAGVHSSPSASALLIRYLAWLATRNMDKTEIKAIMPPKDIVGNYLYTRSEGCSLPHTLSDTRSAVSEELHVNLRTLYRYLAYFEQQGCIQFIHGKIVVTAEGFEKLAERYRDIMDC